MFVIIKITTRFNWRKPMRRFCRSSNSHGDQRQQRFWALCWWVEETVEWDAGVKRSSRLPRGSTRIDGDTISMRWEREEKKMVRVRFSPFLSSLNMFTVNSSPKKKNVYNKWLLVDEAADLNLNNSFLWED